MGLMKRYYSDKVAELVCNLFLTVDVYHLWMKRAMKIFGLIRELDSV